MNIPKQLLNISLLLSISMTLHAMDNKLDVTIVENYAPSSSTSLSATMLVTHADTTILQALAKIKKDYETAFATQENLTQEYQNTVAVLDGLAQRDWDLQQRRKKLRNDYERLQASLPEDQQESIDSVNTDQNSIKIAQDSTELSPKERSSWFDWFFPNK